MLGVPMPLPTGLPRELVLLALALSMGCGTLGGVSPPRPSATPPPPSPTATPRPSPTKTPTCTPTATSTPVPEDMRTILLQTHELMVLVETDAELTLEAARHVEAGEVSETDAPQLIRVIADLADGTDMLVSFAITAGELQSSWVKVLQVHGHTRQVLAEWKGGRMGPEAVIQQMTPDVSAIGHEIDDVENILASEFGLDIMELTQRRAEALQGVRTIFEITPTPREPSQ